MGTEKDMQNILKTRYNTDANFSITREFSILDEEVEELKRKGFYN